MNDAKSNDIPNAPVEAGGASPPAGADGPAPAGDADEGIAPRPRPGFKSARPKLDAHAKAQLVASMFRALIGTVGFAASLLYIPITMATPVLCGVSLLMMVTGTSSTHRVVRNAVSDGVASATLKKVTPALLGLIAVVVVATCTLAAVFGPGAWSPMQRRMSHTADTEDGRVIHFQPPPGR